MARRRRSGPTEVERLVQGDEAHAGAIRTLARWTVDPVSFALEELTFEPDHFQADALSRFNYIRRLALIACKGPGKSALLAVLIWLFVSTRVNAQVAICSITGDNLRDGLWKELRTWYNRSAFLKRTFKFGSDRITRRGHDPDTWFISARQWTKKASVEEQEETLAGLHGPHCLIVVDESGGVPRSVLSAADGILANESDVKRGDPRWVEELHANPHKVIIAGNPTVADGPLWDSVTTEAGLWDVIQVTGDPDDPKRASRVSIRWAREQIALHGIDSPWVQTNVFGRFPKAMTEGVVSAHDFSRAIGRDIDDTGTPLRRGRKTLGVDVARRGKNRTVFVYRDGDFVEKIVFYQGLGHPELRAKTREAIEEWDPEAVFIDDNGIGGALVDDLVDEYDVVVPVNSCEQADESEFHVNRRSEMAAEIQRRFRGGQIALPREVRDTTLQREATGIWFVFTAKGKRRLVDKDEYIRRKGTSPDLYDGLALAFCDGAGLESAGAGGDELEPAQGRLAKVVRLTGRRQEDPEADETEWSRRRQRVRIRA